jgi:hypothetical protein
MDGKIGWFEFSLDVIERCVTAHALTGKLTRKEHLREQHKLNKEFFKNFSHHSGLLSQTPQITYTLEPGVQACKKNLS